eukprot:7986500-Prorocentrum_lima.AAC.1
MPALSSARPKRGEILLQQDISARSCYSKTCPRDLATATWSRPVLSTTGKHLAIVLTWSALALR